VSFPCVPSSRRISGGIRNSATSWCPIRRSRSGLRRGATARHGSGFLGAARQTAQPELLDAGRVSSRHAAEIGRTIVGFTAALPATTRTLAPVLELAQELAAASGYRVDAGAERVALERIRHEMSKSSKLGRAARGLLGSPG
jgi:hypothetical protein